jgi:hypothetical protein
MYSAELNPLYTLGYIPQLTALDGRNPYTATIQLLFEWLLG